MECIPWILAQGTNASNILQIPIRTARPQNCFPFRPNCSVQDDLVLPAPFSRSGSAKSQNGHWAKTRRGARSEAPALVPQGSSQLRPRSQLPCAVGWASVNDPLPWRLGFNRAHWVEHRMIEFLDFQGGPQGQSMVLPSKAALWSQCLIYTIRCCNSTIRSTISMCEKVVRRAFHGW